MRRSTVGREVALQAVTPVLEVLEDRLLMSTNSWKSAVSGSWGDASKWSLGHVPTSSEDVSITASGTYTVSTGTTYEHANKLTIGGGSGTQTLSVGGELDTYSTVNVARSGALNITGGGYVYSYAPANTAATLDGAVTLSGGSAGNAKFYAGGGNYSGVGSVNFATGGSSAFVNQLGFSGGTLASGITVHGKSGDIYGSLTNKGTIKIEGAASDAWDVSGVNNQGSIMSASGATIEFDHFNNAAGKTVSLTGGTSTFYYDFINAGTLSANGTKLKLSADITANGLGTLSRTNSPVTFSGSYDGGGKTFVFDTAGKWNWYGGVLKNGIYDGSAVNALVLDPTQYGSGQMNNVTLSSDLSIPAGTYVSAVGNVTLDSGKRIVLNGKQGNQSAFNIYATLGGTGEVVFNTGGNTNANLLGSGSGTIGSGITVHGKSGEVTYVTNNGLIIADTAGESIDTYGLTNNGNLMAAPGSIRSFTFKQGSGGSLTAGFASSSSYGKFNFADTSTAMALAGTINAVTLNGYAPSNGATFNIASFVKAPTGSFTTKNLDAGNGHAFDLTQTSTALSLKAKAGATFASRSSTGALTITGTANADVITTRQSLGILSATLNGITSVFYDGQIIGEAVHGNAGNDTVSISGGRAVSLFGDAGNDSLVGGSGNDFLDGGEGNDTLLGSGGDDTYVFTAAAASQADVIGESSGNGTGSDTLDFSEIATGVTVNLTSDSALATMTNRTVKTQSSGQAGNFDNVLGGAGADKITGNSASNVFHGGLGNDTLTGGAGADSLYGEDGVDTLFGGGDNTRDLLDGGVGTDIKGSADSIDTLVSIP